MTREEILAKVPDRWNKRVFTEEERLLLWDGKVIFTDDTAVMSDGSTYRMYFILAYDEDTGEYVILKKIDRPGVIDLGVPYLVQLWQEKKKSEHD